MAGDKRNPNKHTPLMRDRIKKRAIELLSGKDGEFSHDAIAEKIRQELSVEVSRQTITRINATASREWKKASMQDIETLKFKILNRYEGLYQELAQKYIESAKDEVTTYSDVSGNVGQDSSADKPNKKAGGKVSKRIVTKHRNGGDKTVLDSMRLVLGDMAKLLGVFEEKVVHSGQLHVDVVQQRFASMTQEELTAYLADNAQYLTHSDEYQSNNEEEEEDGEDT